MYAFMTFFDCGKTERVILVLLKGVWAARLLGCLFGCLDGAKEER